MIRNHENADSRIADAIWWMHGFAAAKPKKAGKLAELAEGLSEIRNWLLRFTQGRSRLLGTDERQLAVVMTEAEFERLFDGLRVKACREDIDDARATVTAILNEFRHERKSVFDPEAPF